VLIIVSLVCDKFRIIQLTLSPADKIHRYTKFLFNNIKSGVDISTYIATIQKVKGYVLVNICGHNWLLSNQPQTHYYDHRIMYCNFVYDMLFLSILYHSFNFLPLQVSTVLSACHLSCCPPITRRRCGALMCECKLGNIRNILSPNSSSPSHDPIFHCSSHISVTI